MGSAFDVPPALWGVLNGLVGALSGTVSQDLGSALVTPIGVGLLIVLLAAADRRRLMLRFGGGKTLWRTVPMKVRLRFIGRVLAVRAAWVLVPGVAGAVVTSVMTSPY